MPLTAEEKRNLIYIGSFMVLLLVIVGVLTAMHVSLILAGTVGVLIVIIVMFGEMIGSKYPKYKMYYYAISLFIVVILIGLALNGQLGTVLGYPVTVEQLTFETLVLAIFIVVAVGAVFLYYAEKKYKVLSKTASKFGL